MLPEIFEPRIVNYRSYGPILFLVRGKIFNLDEYQDKKLVPSGNFRRLTNVTEVTMVCTVMTNEIQYYQDRES
jgi:hypothetical protein